MSEGVDMTRPAEVRYAQRCDASLEDAENIARTFHGTYELLAPSYGYKTRDESAVEWDDVPEANKNLMCATVLALLNANVISPRVAVVRPTRDHAIATLLETEVWPLEWSYEDCRAAAERFADALIREFGVAVSDSQETQ